MYFTGIKVNDKVWSFDFGWGRVEEVTKNSFYVKFDTMKNMYNRRRYCFNGIECNFNNMKNQTIFWDEFIFDIPTKPKIPLQVKQYQIHLNDNYHGSELVDIEIKQQGEDEFYDIANHGLMRDDIDIAYFAYRQIKQFSRLLALRDQECINSKGYKFILNKTNWYIVNNGKQFLIYADDSHYSLCKIYFKTKEDAQYICDILNNEQFDL